MPEFQKMKITITATHGKVPVQCVRITSEDGFSVDIGLVASEIVLDDQRPDSG